MAATREKRSTAGNKMSKLLEAEDEDDFYKTTYGGFNEVINYSDTCLINITLNAFVLL
jgi:vacuolar protein sorting-associated protein 72